jgi:KDO2-lipid IV(A) lauroyltransferase
LTKLWLMRVLRPIVARFPWVFYAVAHGVAGTAWLTRRDIRRMLVRNMLPLCDGDIARARREGRRAMRFVAQYYVDLASLPRRDMARFESEHLALVHGERLAVLEQPGPIVVVSAHTGNAELAVQALTFRGRSFVALVEELKPPAWSEYLLRLRAAAGGHFHEANFGGVRACVEALKAGQLVGVMGDRDIQGTGVCVTLFDREVRIPRGPWELARRTNALVLPVFCSRIERDDFAVWVGEAFRVASSDDMEADVAEAAERYTKLLEDHLKRDPAQWAFLEDFWKVHGCE